LQVVPTYAPPAASHILFDGSWTEALEQPPIERAVRLASAIIPRIPTEDIVSLRV
jgi:hypothetical protein